MVSVPTIWFNSLEILRDGTDRSIKADAFIRSVEPRCSQIDTEQALPEFFPDFGLVTQNTDSVSRSYRAGLEAACSERLNG